ncbi:MAG: TraB/GumN family protein [Gammaproteobacteria bacterium]|nr:TraB/GumN family protein [Gammaproteobacteria bacterium]MDH3362555.1 TraB/GumN family protein [Gammaproteobacteria bacterium]MDH3481348.1 TraB/GumN family protein [Gammaproteobacteria bacterium]
MIRIACVFMLCAVSGLASADSEGHPVTLWRAQGISNSVYLLGSIHLLRAEDHPLPTVIDAAYEDSEVLIMELDMDDLDAALTQQLFTKKGVLRDGLTLRDLMGEELYSRAAAAAETSDIPIDLLAQSKPWLAAITVEMMVLYRIGFNPSLGVEMHMTSRAVEDGKPIEGLETIEEQLAFLDGLSLHAQRELLIQTLEESASIDDSIGEMIRAWRYGDTDFLASGLLDSFAEQEELNDKLVTSRNQRWVSQIIELLDDADDYLIIVGALHLVGDAGVPSLLVQKGIEIMQLSEPASIR